MNYIDVCSGISAPTVAWKPLGWRALCYAEIEAAPRAVLAHHYPDTPLRGDFTEIRGDECGMGEDRGLCPNAIPHTLAFMENVRAELRLSDATDALACGGGKPGQGYAAAMIGSTVRRLTPRECERLQGFPDDFTLVSYRKGMMADGPRYKMLGNSMAVPVVRWIGERIAMVDAITHSATCSLP